MSKEAGLSCKELEKDLNLSVTNCTTVSERQRGKIRQVATSPPLTPDHKKKRLLFAENHLVEGTDFRNWIFTDEKKFNLDGPDGIYYCWQMLGGLQELRCKGSFG